MVLESLLGKTIDFFMDMFWKFFIHAIKIASPIKITPKMIDIDDSEWKKILTIRIENRLNSDLWDVVVVGVSKDAFDLSIISDSSPHGKTVKHMNLNANHVSVLAKERKTKNHLWIFRTHKLSPHERLILKVEINNKSPMFLGLSRYSNKEIYVREREDGAVSIPFYIGKIPKIKNN